MKHMKTLLAGFATLGLLGGAAMVTTINAPIAVAQSSSAKAIVDTAIQNGVVGETAAGYLALVTGSASQDVTNAMNEINAGRKTVYTRLAREQNVSVEVVAALTGEKQIAKQRGGKVLTKDGRWMSAS